MYNMVNLRRGRVILQRHDDDTLRHDNGIN